MQTEISTAEAAQRLRVSPQRVLRMLHTELLSGRRIGRVWLVDAESVAARLQIATDAGRPWSAKTVIDIIDALSFGAPLNARHAGLVRRVDASGIASRLEQSVRVKRYSTRWSERVEEFLLPTAASALDRVVSEPSRLLTAATESLHGYLRPDINLAGVVAEARLVADPRGAIHIYELSARPFPWTQTPPALIAADSTMAGATRVRSAGLDALQQMRDRWLTSTT